MGLPQRERPQLQPPPAGSAPRLSPGPCPGPGCSLRTAALMQLPSASGTQIIWKFIWEQRDLTRTWPGPWLLSQRRCWLILLVTPLLRASLALLVRVYGLRVPKNAYRASEQRSAAARSCISTSQRSPNSADTLTGLRRFRYVPLPSLHLRTEIALCINGSPAPPTKRETKQSMRSSAH